jgi:opacity protein-like surface antigen
MMNALPHTRILYFVLLLVITLPACAQINVSNYEAGLNAGTFIYQGDLTPSRLGSYRTLRPQVGIFGSRLLSSHFSFRLNFDAGSLSGDESKFASPAWRRDRNFKFSSPLYELSGQLVWDLLGRNYSRPAKSLSPYLFAGIGYSYIHVSRDFSAMNTSVFSPESGVPARLAADAAGSNRRGALVFPAGIGLRYALTQKISVIAETSYRFTTTDYLDGFSYAANPAKNDHYQSHSLGIVYSFGKKNSWDCPVKP